MRSFRPGLAAALAAALAVSCAPPPAPRPSQPPPVTRPGEKAGGEGAAAPSAPPAPSRLAGEPLIDVGLAWDLDRLMLTPDSRVRLRLGAGQGRPAGEASGPVTVRLEAGRAVWATAGGRSGREGAIGPQDTLWLDERGGLLGWNGRRWRGTAKIFLNPRGRLTLALRLPLDTYLLGVVPEEIGGLQDELLEAGRAQAVAARSYTLFYLGRRAAEGFDIFGTVEDQVYGPVERERPLASRCVESTRGLVALSDGQPIRANYCSTCGGITAEVWEAWPAAPLPYLTSHPDRGSGDHCAGSPQYRWREEWAAEEFLADIARFGPAQDLELPAGGLGELLDVRADARSRSGRVWRLTVATTTGTLSIPAYSIRQVLRRGGNPGAVLRSNLFKIDVRRDPATRRALAVVASGAGFGHGVGLCQTGALGMARASARAETILTHYYPGVELKRLY